MIGIDVVDVLRFSQSSRLPRFLRKFDVDGSSALCAAKTWACIEAVIKASDCDFCPTDIQIKFPKGQRPLVQDPNQVLDGEYVLSVSHTRHQVIAIAQRTHKESICK
jgi:phosphopantetheinyl transferase (holo-ACP synthase)